MSFSHSPLPLFVIPAHVVQEYPWEENEARYKHMIIRKFLEETTMIYSPKWGEAEAYRDDMRHHIDLGNTNGILHHDDVMVTLQYALISRLSKNEKEKENIIGEILSLQNLSKEEFIEWVRGREKYYNDNQRWLVSLLEMMVDTDDTGDQESVIQRKRMTKIYAMIKMFDTQRLKARH